MVRFTWTEKTDDQGDVESEEDEEDVESEEDGEDVESEEDEEDVESEEDEEDEANLNYDDIALIKPVVDGTVYTTPATIWVGVMLNTLTGEVAHHSANDIQCFLRSSSM